MNDHNLDDLIIGEPESGGKGSKSLLTLIGLILIILIVGVFLAKLIFSEPESTSKEATTELTGVVKPLQHETTDRGKEPKAQPAEEIPDDLKPLSQEPLPESDELTPLKPTVSHAAAQTRRTPSRQTAPLQPVRPKTTVSKKHAPKPKRTVKKPTPRQLFARQKPKAKSEAKPAAAKKIYYIQVGSFKRMPNQKYLDKIKAQGYRPIIVRSGAMIKVRVGPYGSYAEAKAKLPEVKEKLGISGFVVRKQ